MLNILTRLSGCYEFQQIHVRTYVQDFGTVYFRYLFWVLTIATAKSSAVTCQDSKGWFMARSGSRSKAMYVIILPRDIKKILHSSYEQYSVRLCTVVDLCGAKNKSRSLTIYSIYFSLHLSHISGGILKYSSHMINYCRIDCRVITKRPV